MIPKCTLAVVFLIVFVKKNYTYKPDDSYFEDIAIDDPNVDINKINEDFDDVQNGEEEQNVHMLKIKKKNKIEQTNKGVCVINVGNPNISGSLIFTETLGGSVKISGEINGLPPVTMHGFHVHQTGDIRGANPCDSTGPHFNPYNVSHGAPTDVERHVGDLGNIMSDSNGKTKINITDHVISLTPGSKRNIIGRAIVIHQNADDLGRGGVPLSKTTGNAGARIACGLIGIL